MGTKGEYEFNDKTYLLSFNLDVYGNGSFTEYIRHVFYHPIGSGKMFMIGNSGNGNAYLNEEDYKRKQPSRAITINGMINWTEDRKPVR